MLSFLDWAKDKYDLDLKRVFTAGASMGGSGAPMFAIRYSERIAWCVGWVGVHNPARSPHFKGSYEGVYGKQEWNLEFEDGTPVWNYYNDCWYLRKYPRKEIGFITWANGKNDSAIGWPQAFEFYRTMQETRRPHIFVWGMSGHGQRAVMPKGGQRVMHIDIRLDQSLPAFTHCSLDDDPGTATKLAADALAKRKAEIDAWNQAHKRRKHKLDIYDGKASGQVNAFLCWETKDLVDEADRWSITVGLIKSAPKDECSVDVTPRRLQKLQIKPGDTFTWTNTSSGKQVQAGTAAADAHGLITLQQLRVGKAGNRLSLTRK